MLEGVDRIGGVPRRKASPNSLNRTRASSSCAWNIGATAAMSSWLNSRPIAAPTGRFLHGEAVQPSHQGVPQGRRNRDAGSRASIVVEITFLFQVAGFQNGLGQFLDKQGNAVGPGQDLLESAPGSAFPPARVETIAALCGRVSLAGSWRDMSCLDHATESRAAG